jgi:hypothetical protein
VVDQLAEKYPTTYGKIIPGLFVFSRGGINSQGGPCGAWLSGAALLHQMGAPSAMQNAFLRWFENASMPSNGAYQDYRAGDWTPPGGWGGSGMPIPLNNAPRVKAKTTSCHGGRTKWQVAASGWLAAYGTSAIADRCSKVSYDCVVKLVQMINQWKSGVAVTDPGDAVVSGCKTSGCHGSYPIGGVTGTPTCLPCHSSVAGVTPGHGM